MAKIYWASEKGMKVFQALGGGRGGAQESPGVPAAQAMGTEQSWGAQTARCRSSQTAARRGAGEAPQAALGPRERCQAHQLGGRLASWTPARDPSLPTFAGLGFCPSGHHSPHAA